MVALNKILIYFLLGLIIFFRPLIDGVTYEWSNTVFQILVLMMVLLWLGRQLQEGRIALKSTPIDLPVILFIFFLGLSLIKSVSIHDSLQILPQFICYAIIFYVVANVTKKNDAEKFLVLALFTGFLVSIYGFYQYKWGLANTRQWLTYLIDSDHITPAFRARLASNDIFSTFVYPPALGGYLVLLFPLSFSLWLKEFKKPVKFISLSILLLSLLAALFLTRSKAGWLTFLLAGVFYLILLFLITRKQKEMKPRWIPVLVFILVLLVAGAFLLHKEPLQIPEMKNYLRSFQVRYEYWQAGWKMIQERPLLGFGPGGFGSVYARYKLPEAEEVRLAHNNFIQVWSDSGVFTFLAFIWLWGVYLFFSIRWLLKQSPPGITLLRLGLICGITGFLIHSMVDFDLYVPGIAANVWILMGLTMALRDEPVRVHQFEIRNITLRRLSAVALVFLAFAVSINLVRPMLANKHAEIGQEYLKQGDLPNATAEFQGAIRLTPLNPEYHFRLAKLYETLLEGKASGEGRVDTEILAKMMSEYKEAIRLEPWTPYFHYHLAIAYIRWVSQDDPERIGSAVSELKKACELYPSKAFYHAELGALYKAIGEKDKSDAEFALAKQLDPSL